jgi:hypothetical protein
MRKVLATLVAVAAALLVMASPGSAADSSCVSGSWPADVQGRPAGLQRLGAEGLYVWHTSNGWRVAVTHPDTSKVEFTGSIRTDGQLYGVERRTERNDHVVFSEDADGVHYRFENYGGLDGIAFGTKCSNRLVFDGNVDGQPLTANQIFIGADGHHPGGVPFVITRNS